MPLVKDVIARTWFIQQKKNSSMAKIRNQQLMVKWHTFAVYTIQIWSALQEFTWRMDGCIVNLVFPHIITDLKIRNERIFKSNVILKKTVLTWRRWQSNISCKRNIRKAREKVSIRSYIFKYSLSNCVVLFATTWTWPHLFSSQIIFFVQEPKIETK